MHLYAKRRHTAFTVWRIEYSPLSRSLTKSIEWRSISCCGIYFCIGERETRFRVDCGIWTDRMLCLVLVIQESIDVVNQRLKFSVLRDDEWASSSIFVLVVTNTSWMRDEFSMWSTGFNVIISCQLMRARHKRLIISIFLAKKKVAPFPNNWTKTNILK